MKKIIRNIVIVIYAVIAIFITICLLSYNDYKVTEFGNTSLLIIDNNELNPEYNKGDLAIVEGNKKIEAGDKIFFYNSQAAISLAEVIKVEDITETQSTYTLEGNKPISSDYLIGKQSETKKIENIGTILSVLESKWGFLLLVVLPAVIAFLYEIVAVITELRGSKKNDEEKEKSTEGRSTGGRSSGGRRRH